MDKADKQCTRIVVRLDLLGGRGWLSEYLSIYGHLLNQPPVKNYYVIASGETTETYRKKNEPFYPRHEKEYSHSRQYRKNLTCTLCWKVMKEKSGAV